MTNAVYVKFKKGFEPDLSDIGYEEPEGWDGGEGWIYPKEPFDVGDRLSIEGTEGLKLRIKDPLGYYLFLIPEGEDPLQMARRLLESGKVQEAYPSGSVRGCDTGRTSVERTTWGGKSKPNINKPDSSAI